MTASPDQAARFDRSLDAAGFDIRYWLDIGEVIVDIALDWDQFARDNNAPELLKRHVIGRNLLNFVSGDVTRMYVRTLIQSARLMRQPMVRQYRCDSPDMRRYMEMRLSLQDNGLLCWEHRQLASEKLPNRLNFVHAADSRTRRPHVRCSICNRLKGRSGWNEPDLLGEDFLPTESVVPVIYGVCPDCLSGRSVSR